MNKKRMEGQYTMLRLAKKGILPDKRTAIRKSFDTFEDWLKQPYGESWNTLQEARWALAVPWVIFWLTAPMLMEDKRISTDYMKVTDRLERTIRDIVELADKEPSKAPSLKDYLREVKASERHQVP